MVSLDILTSSGEIITARRGEPDFAGLVVGLGALGAVVRVTLDVEPEFAVRQRVYEGLRWDALLANLDAITASGDSVSVFTRWGETADQVWVKTRVSDEPEEPRRDLFGAIAATVQRTPSSGAELQSEYMVARTHACGAIEALLRMGQRIAPLIQVSELRTVAADELWLSPQYGQDTLCIHFTWQPEADAVARILPEVEAALEDFAARPHWGKLFAADAQRIAFLYDRLPDFVRLLASLDPRGAFRNAWLRTKCNADP